VRWAGGCASEGSGSSDGSCATIAEVLRPAGYRTMPSGKWHLGGDVKPSEVDVFDPARPGPPVTPLQRGFDDFWGLYGGAANYYSPSILMDGYDIIDAEDPAFYLTDAITSHAVDMIDRAVAGQRPFFLYLAYTTPHWPLHALEEDIARYERTYRPGWDQIRAERHERLRDAGQLDPRWQISARDPGSNPLCRGPVLGVGGHADGGVRGPGRPYGPGRRPGRRPLAGPRAARRHRHPGLLGQRRLVGVPPGGGRGRGADRYRGSTVDGLPVRIGNIPDLAPGEPATFMSYDPPWANASNSPFRRYKSWVHEGGISTPLVVHWRQDIQQPGIRTTPVRFTDVLPHHRRAGRRDDPPRARRRRTAIS
jgi:arylsulfatase